MEFYITTTQLFLEFTPLPTHGIQSAKSTSTAHRLPRSQPAVQSSEGSHLFVIYPQAKQMT